MAFTIQSRDLAGNANQSRIYDTDLRILTDGLAGVGVVSGCGVTAQGSPDMTVAIAAGTIRIASGALVAVASGNGTIGTADATNPRIDLISASNAGVKTVTAGTAAPSPKPPDLPAGNVALAMVYVAANDTAISTGEITDKRVVLAAGSPLAQGSSFPASPSANDLFYRTDRSLLYFYDGTRWLTTVEFALHLAASDTLQGSNNTTAQYAPIDYGANGAWATRYVAWTLRATGNSSNFVTWSLDSVAGGGTTHNLASFSTTGDTAGTRTAHTGTIGAAVTASDALYQLSGAKTGSPTGLYGDITIYYRLIG